MHLGTSHTKIVVAESGFGACVCIFYSNRSSMVINLRGLDKCASDHTGNGQTDDQTRMEVRTVNIYKCVRSNAVTRGVTERRTYMSWVIIDMF